MSRRTGVLAASLFSLGAVLGLSTSAAFLQVDDDQIKESVTTNLGVRGPLADVVLDVIDEQDVFGVVADDVRSDQRRNIALGAAAAAIAAAGIGVAASRRSGRRDGPDHATEGAAERTDGRLAPVGGSAEQTGATTFGAN